MFPAAHGFNKLQIPSGGKVKFHIFTAAMNNEFNRAGNFTFIVGIYIPEKSVRRLFAKFHIIGYASAAFGNKLLRKIFGVIGGKAFIGEHVGNAAADLFRYKEVNLIKIQKFIIKQYFGRHIAAYLSNYPLGKLSNIFSAFLNQMYLSSRNVREHHSAAFFGVIQTENIIVFAFIQHTVLYNSTRSYYSHYLPPYKPLCNRRILHLLAYRDSAAVVYKPFYVRDGGMMGHSAHMYSRP